MKIVCDSCSTKYSISDDKVRGKVFKIRCKKCSHIIVVKGTAEAAPAAPETPTDAIWHLVVDGDQIGPLTDADVRARLSRGEITAENYVWKEGFSDWLRLAEVPEFADVASGQAAPVTGELFTDSERADATEVGDREALAGSGGELGSFFGSAAPGPEGAALSMASGGLPARNRAAASETLPEDDAFSVPAVGAAAPASEGADLFGAVAPAARVDSGRVRGRGSNGAAAGGRHDGGRVENLTAQRSENSVLFSLSNLQSLAAPAASAKPGAIQTTEGSGLIDIRAMAASTMKAPAAAGGGLSVFGGAESRSTDDDLPAFGAFSAAAPVLLPIPSSSGPPRWVYPLLALGLLLVVAILVLAVSILGKPVMVEQAAAPVVAAAPESAPRPKVAPKPTEESPPAAKPIAVGDLPPREGGGSASASAEKPAAEKASIPKGGGAKKGRGRKTVAAAGAGDAKGAAAGAGVAASAASASAAAEPEKPKPAKGSLDDLLEGALNGKKGRPKVEDDTAPSRKGGGGDAAGAGPLAKAAVVAGMNGVKGKVSSCYAQFKVPGMAMVNVVIGKSGKVSSATVTGKFAGTPTGTCVESAVKTASFPPSDGLTTPYPFSLR